MGLRPGVLKGVNIVTSGWNLCFGHSEGLGMMIHHDTVASGELGFSCTFYCLGLQWCMSILISKISTTVPVNHFSFAPYCFCGKNLTCSFTFRISLVLGSVSSVEVFFLHVFCISSSHRRILWMLAGLWHRGMTAPCVGPPCKISAGDGKSFVIGVSRNCNNGSHLSI